MWRITVRIVKRQSVFNLKKFDFKTERLLEVCVFFLSSPVYGFISVHY